MGLNWLDGSIVIAYLLAITLYGSHFRKKQQSIHTYFLGGKTTPAWALSLSIVATETSTFTIISTPGIAFGGNLSFLQLVIGYMVGRIFISLVLIPAYFKGEMFTAYELMQRRFGPRTKHATASMFLVTRAMADGVRIYAVAIVVGMVLGFGDIWSILIIFVLTLIYTFEGGLTAVIWTDVVQLFIYLAAHCRLFCNSGTDPGRLAGSDGSRRPQVGDLGFFPEFSSALHILGRGDRRSVPEYRQPRSRSADRAAAAGGQK